jgi:hypothetical protein
MGRPEHTPQGLVRIFKAFLDFVDLGNLVRINLRQGIVRGLNLLSAVRNARSLFSSQFHKLPPSKIT